MMLHFYSQASNFKIKSVFHKTKLKKGQKSLMLEAARKLIAEGRLAEVPFDDLKEREENMVLR